MALLRSAVSDDGPASLQGAGFTSTAISGDDLSGYLTNAKVPATLISEFCAHDANAPSVRREAISEDGCIVAVGVLKIPKGMEPVAQLLVHIRPEHSDCDMFADFMLSTLVKSACRDSAISMELIHLPRTVFGQQICKGVGLSSNRRQSHLF